MPTVCPKVHTMHLLFDIWRILVNIMVGKHLVAEGLNLNIWGWISLLDMQTPKTHTQIHAKQISFSFLFCKLLDLISWIASFFMSKKETKSSHSFEKVSFRSVRSQKPNIQYVFKKMNCSKISRSKRILICIKHKGSKYTHHIYIHVYI